MRRTIVFTATLCLLLTGCSRSPTYYVDKGNSLSQSGKLEDASLQYRKALQKDPNFGEAYYRLGLLNIRQKNIQGAYESLTRAVQLMPTREDAKVQLADICLQEYLFDRRLTALYGQVVKISDELLAKDANSFHGLRLKGSVALADKRPGEAVQYLQKANQVKPMDPEVVVTLTRALFLDNQVPAGEQLAQRLIRENKSVGPIYDVLYQHYSQTNRPADAEGILKTKVQNNPQQAGYLLQLADHYARANRPKEVADTLQQLLDRPKDFPEAHLLVGDFYARSGKWQQAVAQFQEGARANSKDALRYQKRILSAMLAQGKKAEASQTVEQILKAYPNDGDGRAIRATLWLESGKAENIGPALAEFQALVKDRPENAALRFNLGRAFIATGATDKGRVELLEAIRLKRDYLPPRFVLAVMALRQQRPRETLRYANEILFFDANNAQGRLLRAIGLSGTGKYAEARALLLPLEQAFPQSQQIKVQLGVVALGLKNYKEAEEIFAKVRQSGPDDLESATGLVETFSAENHYDKALQLLQEARKKSPDSVALGTLLASTAIRAGNYDLAVSEYQQLLSKNPKSAQICLRLGEVYVRKGDLGSAIPMFQQARKLSPKDPAAATQLANALMTAGRADEAKLEYQRALELRPDDPFIQNSLAFSLSESGSNLDEAQQLAQRAIQKMPGQPNFADTLGCIYLKKKMNDSALQVFNRLVQQTPDNPTFRYHRAMALLEKGEKAAAKTELQEAQARQPTPVQARKITELMDKLN